MKTSRTVAAQGRVQDRSGAGPLCGQEVESVLLAARRVTRSLKAGAPPVSAAIRVPRPAPYGIGVMLFRLWEKQLLTCDELAYEALLSHLPGPFGPTGGATPAGRRTVIEHLRKMRLIGPDLPVRALKPTGTTPNVTHVLQVTERLTGVPIADILSRNRSRDIVEARFFAMWTLRTVSGTSFSVIGEQFGGKDHTTVINAVAQVDLKRRLDGGDRDLTDRIMDEADLLGVKANMDLLLRPCRLRAIG